MNNIRSTLATVWRIAAPYFRSEDKWAGRGLLAAVIAIELAIVGINVLLNQWNSRFYNALQERNWDNFVYRDHLFLRPRRHLHRARGLPALSQSMAADPLAALDDRALSRRLAASGQPLPDAASGRRRRQPRPAHDRRRQAVRRSHAQHRGRPAELDRHAGSFVVDPVGPFERRAAAPVRHGISQFPATWSGAR